MNAATAVALASFKEERIEAYCSIVLCSERE